MRTEVERIEPSYCQLSNADGHPDCADVTNGEFVKICDGNADVCTYHDTEALWQLQYAAIQDLLTAVRFLVKHHTIKATFAWPFHRGCKHSKREEQRGKRGMGRRGRQGWK